jgi:hypothetical protein
MFDDQGDDNDNVRPLRRPTLRPVSRDTTAGPLSRLRGSKCFQEVDRRLRLGWSTSDIVRMIQEEYGELKDLSTGYVRKMVDEYRSSLPPTELALSSNSRVVRSATKRLAEGLDELAELEKLYEIQFKRIQIDFENEQKINKLLNGTGREVFVAMKLLRQSAELKMDLGLVKRQLGTMEVTGQLAAEIGERYGRDSIGKVIADPDSRRKVLGIAEKLLALGAKASLDAVEVLGQAAEEAQEEAASESKIIDVTPAADHPSE